MHNEILGMSPPIYFTTVTITELIRTAPFYFIVKQTFRTINVIFK